MDVSAGRGVNVLVRGGVKVVEARRCEWLMGPAAPLSHTPTLFHKKSCPLPYTL